MIPDLAVTLSRVKPRKLQVCDTRKDTWSGELTCRPAVKESLTRQQSQMRQVVICRRTIRFNVARSYSTLLRESRSEVSMLEPAMASMTNALNSL